MLKSICALLAEPVTGNAATEKHDASPRHVGKIQGDKTILLNLADCYVSVKAASLCTGISPSNRPLTADCLCRKTLLIHVLLHASPILAGMLTVNSTSPHLAGCAAQLLPRRAFLRSHAVHRSRFLRDCSVVTKPFNSNRSKVLQGPCQRVVPVQAAASAPPKVMFRH